MRPSRLLRSAIVLKPATIMAFHRALVKRKYRLLFTPVEIDKDVVRRVLARRYRPEPGSQGPSWLTFLGHSKDSLWSVDLFRCESLILRTHCAGYQHRTQTTRPPSTGGNVTAEVCISSR